MTNSKDNKNNYKMINAEKARDCFFELNKLIKFFLDYLKEKSRIIDKKINFDKADNECTYLLVEKYAREKLFIDLYELLKKIKKEDFFINDKTLEKMEKMRAIRNFYGHLRQVDKKKPKETIDEKEILSILKDVGEELKESLFKGEILDYRPHKDEVANLVKFLTSIDPRLTSIDPQLLDVCKKTSGPSNDINQMTISQFLDVCEKKDVKDYHNLKMLLKEPYGFNYYLHKKDHVRLNDFILETRNLFQSLFLCIHQIQETKDFGTKELILNYKHLWKVEKAFRDIKGFLKTRPMFHWTDKRILGHLVLCFISYLCEAYLSKKLYEKGIKCREELMTGQNKQPRQLSVSEAMLKLKEVRAVPVTLKDKTLWMRTDITGYATDVFKAIGVKIPAKQLKVESSQSQS